MNMQELYKAKPKAEKKVSDSLKADGQLVVNTNTHEYTLTVTGKLSELLEKGKITKDGKGTERFATFNAKATDQDGDTISRVRCGANVFVKFA